MDTKISYMRQTDLFNPINQKYKIVVFGAGALGSFITLNLAKLGFNDITVYDNDFVNAYNIPNQFYRLKDVGELKVNALRNIIKDFCDLEIKVDTNRVTEKTEINVELNTIFIVTFDNLKSRKIIYDKLKDYNCYCLDVRAGGEEFYIYSINTFDDEALKIWKNSFKIIPTKLKCGAKSIIYTNLAVASEACNIVKKINNDEEYPIKLIRHMKYYDILHSKTNDVKKSKLSVTEK